MTKSRNDLHDYRYNVAFVGTAKLLVKVILSLLRVINLTNGIRALLISDLKDKTVSDDVDGELDGMSM